MYKFRNIFKKKEDVENHDRLPAEEMILKEREREFIKK